MDNSILMITLLVFLFAFVFDVSFNVRRLNKKIDELVNKK